MQWLTLPTFLFTVSKTNLAVHEDKNRVPFVKVCMAISVNLSSRDSDPWIVICEEIYMNSVRSYLRLPGFDALPKKLTTDCMKEWRSDVNVFIVGLGSYSPDKKGRELVKSLILLYYIHPSILPQSPHYYNALGMKTCHTVDSWFLTVRHMIILTQLGCLPWYSVSPVLVVIVSRDYSLGFHPTLCQAVMLGWIGSGAPQSVAHSLISCDLHFFAKQSTIFHQINITFH